MSSVPVAVIACLVMQQPPPAAWKPADGPLLTRWAAEVDADRAHVAYPRPQMRRERWTNLNGLWSYAVTAGDAGPPGTFDGTILVPFPIESALSGVMRRLGPEETLWYRRTFSRPRSAAADGRVLLHFGASDWETEVQVNGHAVGRHRGGYDPFTFDITDALAAGDAQELLVAVRDPTDAGTQPRGKQVREPHGIWYTPTSGIWQTVWLEVVPAIHVQRYVVTTELDEGTVRVEPLIHGGQPGDQVLLEIRDAGITVARAEGAVEGATSLKLHAPKPWSPDSPHLYDLIIAVRRDQRIIDRVHGYFGFRTIALGKDKDGRTRIFLNGRPVFIYGPLDQGFWPDGLYTAPNDEALRFDIETMKRLGFNAVRKHVKIEPSRWYFWCDRLGLMVLQDMPSGDAYARPGAGEISRTADSAAQFEQELRAMIDAFVNHPSIVMWIPFNEGWGQYDTVRIAEWIREHDPTRLVDCASGWNDYPVGDVHDVHRYPGPGSPTLEPDRAAMLGEFGGLGLPVRDHTWQAEENWGYRSYETSAELTAAYCDLLERLRWLIAARGLSVAIYTQLTDVEIEVNGLLTYDRAVVKMDEDRVREAARRLHRPPLSVRTVVPCAHDGEAVVWRYTTTAPNGDWMAPDYDDSDWKQGPGGFGTKGTPGAVVGTTWDTNEIWLRRSIDLTGVDPAGLALLIHHDEDAEVYLNGHLIAALTGYTTDYAPVRAATEWKEPIRPGLNCLAIRCRQTGGGQYIDAGLVTISGD